MTFFIIHIFLTIIWVLLSSSYNVIDFGLGFIVSYFAIVLSQPLGLKGSYFYRIKNCIYLVIYLFFETILSSSKISLDVLTPSYNCMPDIVKVPLSVTSDLEVAILANMISLTPGTLVLDIDEDKKHIIIHAMFAQNHSEVVAQIKNKLEEKLLRVSHG